MGNRPALMPLDETFPCMEGGTRDIFEWLIDHGNSRAVRAKQVNEKNAYIEKAKAVCATCPRDIKAACLESNGRVYDLGVIAGMTDAERLWLYEKRRL